MGCIPEKVEPEYVPCTKSAQIHKRKAEQWRKEHPTTEDGIWAVFWCWAFNNCRGDNNDKQR